MRKNALVLICLAFAGHGRDIATDQQSSRRMAPDGQPTALASLLLSAGRSSAAWQVPVVGDLARRATRSPTSGSSRIWPLAMGEVGARQEDESEDTAEDDTVLDTEEVAELGHMKKEEEERSEAMVAALLIGLISLGSDVLTIDGMEQLGLFMAVATAVAYAASDGDGPVARLRESLGHTVQDGLTFASEVDKELEIGWKLRAMMELAAENAGRAKSEDPASDEYHKAVAAPSQLASERELRQAMEAVLPLKVPKKGAKSQPVGIMERAVSMTNGEALREMREGRLCTRNFVRSRLLRLNGKGPFAGRPK